MEPIVPLATVVSGLLCNLGKHKYFCVLFVLLESTVFPVTYLNVSKELAFQRLLVEWDVGKSAHDAELAMSFEIQVRRTGETTTVWTVSVFLKRHIAYLQYKGS